MSLFIQSCSPLLCWRDNYNVSSVYQTLCWLWGWGGGLWGGAMGVENKKATRRETRSGPCSHQAHNPVEKIKPFNAYANIRRGVANLCVKYWGNTEEGQLTSRPSKGGRGGHRELHKRDDYHLQPSKCFSLRLRLSLKSSWRMCLNISCLQPLSSPVLLKVVLEEYLGFVSSSVHFLIHNLVPRRNRIWWVELNRIKDASCSNKSHNLTGLI